MNALLTLISKESFRSKNWVELLSICGKTVHVRKSEGEIWMYFFIADLLKQKFWKIDQNCQSYGLLHGSGGWSPSPAILIRFKWNLGIVHHLGMNYPRIISLMTNFLEMDYLGMFYSGIILQPLFVWIWLLFWDRFDNFQKSGIVGFSHDCFIFVKWYGLVAY